MCQTSILPTMLRAEQVNNDIMQLTYVLNRWLRMIKNYGKLDETTLESDIELISRVIESSELKNGTKRILSVCRFYAISDVKATLTFADSLKKVLNTLCKFQEDRSIKKVKKIESDQGMTERYRPLSKKLEKEKIRRLGKHLSFTDIHAGDSYEVKLIRRIVEKRAAQNVHRLTKKHNKETNQFRQSVRRAISFSLYNTNFTDYDARKRAPGTHWRVYYTSKGNKMLKSKKSYDSYEAAVDACNNYLLAHPEDQRPLNAYKCDFCGKWHIGHNREDVVEEIVVNIQKAC